MSFVPKDFLLLLKDFVLLCYVCEDRVLDFSLEIVLLK